MTDLRKFLILIAAGGSAAVLLAAIGSQYIGGLAPCHLCILQRWPHATALLIGALALAFRARILPLLGALAALTTSGIGVYHTGVERGWWEGPTTCTSGPVGGMSTDDLLNQIMNAPLVRCDEVAWQLLGMSMASWNALISFGLALVWVAVWRRTA